MNRRLAPILIAVAVLGLTSMACESAVKRFFGAPADICDASEYLDVKYEVLEEKSDADGTDCDYSITITNMSEHSIQPFLYAWQENPFQEDKGGEWIAMNMFTPGWSSKRFGTYGTSTDRDASGPHIEEFQRIAGVFDTERCGGTLSDARQLDDKGTGILEGIYILVPDIPCNPDR